MNSYLNNIDTTKVPTHVAIIMDGNGRWAKQIGKNRLFGHQNAIQLYGKVPNLPLRLELNF